MLLISPQVPCAVQAPAATGKSLQQDVVYQAEVQADCTAAQQPQLAERRSRRMVVRLVGPSQRAPISLKLCRGGGPQLRGALSNALLGVELLLGDWGSDERTGVILLQGLTCRLQPASA